MKTLLFLIFSAFTSAADIFDTNSLMKKFSWSEEADKKMPLDILKKDKKFTKLVDAFDKFPDLLEELKSPHGHMTIFAPTNDAFEKSSQFNRDTLKQILKYHMSTVEIKQHEFKDRLLIPTELILEGLKGKPQMIKVWICGENVFVGNDAKKTKIIFDEYKDFHHGILYPIHEFLVPPINLKDQSLIIQTPYSLMTFFAAIQHAGITDILAQMEGLTVLAPSDDAFSSLGEKLLQFLFSPLGKPFLRKLLMYHMIPPQEYPLYSYTIPKESRPFKTLLMEKTLTLERRSGPLIIANNKAFVSYSDVLGSNGVLHIIDRVLIPFHVPQEIE